MEKGDKQRRPDKISGVTGAVKKNKACVKGSVDGGMALPGCSGTQAHM